MIEIKGVSHRFGSRQALDNINLTITERRVAIVGANGSGKSTFARLLNGLLIPDSGQVLIDHCDTRRDLKTIRRKVGFVFQNPDHQIILPIVEEDIAFGLKNLKLGKAEIAAKTDAILKQYRLEQLRHQPAHLLSGGEKQLLAIAAVLVLEPDYIIFDEPTTLLDLRNKNKIALAIRELAQTAIVVSHDLELLQDFERIIVFDEGRVVMDDRPALALPFYRRLMA